MKKVLFVEDDEAQHKALRSWPFDFDIEIISAYDIVEGWAKFQEHVGTLDAIVLDGQLGTGQKKHYGHALAHQIRASGYTGPMIAASSDHDLNMTMLRYGCNIIAEKMKVVLGEVLEGLLKAQN